MVGYTRERQEGIQKGKTRKKTQIKSMNRNRKGWEDTKRGNENARRDRG
jgi:hypothetical protein